MITKNLHPRLLLLRRLRHVAFLEGTTLLLLLLVAVPLEHWGHQPLGLAVIGPLHGVVFTIGDVGILIGASLVPFGSIAGAALIRRRTSDYLGQRAKSLFRSPR